MFKLYWKVKSVSLSLQDYEGLGVFQTRLLGLIDDAYSKHDKALRRF